MRACLWTMTCGTLLVSPTVTVAQESSPTLEATAAWLSSELPRLASIHYQRITRSMSSGGDVAMAIDKRTSDVVLDGCTLHWTATHAVDGSVRLMSKLSAPLGRVDPQAITVGAALTLAGVSHRPSVYTLNVRSPRSLGAPFTYQGASDPAPKPDFGFSFDFTDRNGAVQVAQALKRAATLCGAHASPF